VSRSKLSSALVVAAFVAGCRDRAPEPEGRGIEAKETPSPTTSAAPTTAPATPPEPESPKPRVHWTDPGGWTRVASTSPMRLATYRVPKAHGDQDDGELSVFNFGSGKGGDVKANLDRWERQFSDVKPNDVHRSERSVNGLAAHVLEIGRGTFASGMPGEPPKTNKGYGLVGAIVETPAGSYFFKLTGPEKTVKAEQANFYTLLDSVKVENER
jgi:hypothetical protein